MNYVYILKSEKNGRYYIGSTNNMDRRLQEHNSGKTKSLKSLRPLLIVFVESFDTMDKARAMELRLKKLKSRVILEKIITDQKIIMGR